MLNGRIYMKYLLLLLSSYTLLLHGCVGSKKSLDKEKTLYLSRNAGLVERTARYAIMQTLGEKENHFTAEQVPDRYTRKDIESLGRQVNVFYQSSFNSAGADSIVIFKNITPFGTTEVIYDFAARQRSFPEKTERPKEFYFIKISERIYYVRRQVSLM
jgi:hypothetical protein